MLFYYCFILFMILLGIYFNSQVLLLSIPIVVYLFNKSGKVKSLIYFIIIIGGYLIIQHIKFKSINFYLLINYIVITLIMLLTIFKTVKSKDQYIKLLQDQVLSTEGNEILSNILKLAVNDEKYAITESAEKICTVLRKFYKIDYCTILLNNQRGLHIVATNIEKQYSNYMELYSNRLLENIEENSATIQCSDVCLSYPTANFRGIKYLYFIPLLIGNDLIGALLLEDKQRDRLEKIENDLFKLVIENISIVLQNFIYHDRLVAAAMIDGLTQIWNRVYLKKYLKVEMDKHNKSNSSLSLAMFDIDHFKKFNDTYGHLHGDKVLKEVSNFVKSSIRADEDIIARYGGEEFIIVLTRTNNQEVYDKIDDIRKGIANLSITNDENEVTPVTVSFGIAEFPKDAKDIENLISKADKALYYSKGHGRNKVTKYKF